MKKNLENLAGIVSKTWDYLSGGVIRRTYREINNELNAGALDGLAEYQKYFIPSANFYLVAGHVTRGLSILSVGEIFLPFHGDANGALYLVGVLAAESLFGVIKENLSLIHDQLSLLRSISDGTFMNDQNEFGKRKFDYANNPPKKELSVLGLDASELISLSPEQKIIRIKNAYRKLALIFHPDTNPDGEEKMKEINQRYNYLMNLYGKK